VSLCLSISAIDRLATIVNNSRQIRCRLPRSYKQLAGLIAAPLAVLALWFAPTHDDPAAQHAIAIALMIILWATRRWIFALAGFIGVFLFWALGVSRFEDAFSGFSNETPWFLLAPSSSEQCQQVGPGQANRVHDRHTGIGGRHTAGCLLAFIIAIPFDVS